VVARALEKRPEDRYETVAELVEDFTIAAGMEPASVSTAVSSGRLESSTPQPIDEDDTDEETLVRRRVTRPMMPPPEPEMPSVVPSVLTPQSTQIQSASGFNPWKVLIPSMIGLLVIFGVIYAFSRNSQPTNATTPTSSPLAADPNSSPVEPAKPPTGAPEAGLPAGGATNQAANANTNTNPSASPEPRETPSDIGGVDLNANDNANENSNTKKPANLPLPSPTRSVDSEPPPPAPTATKAPLPKPVVPAANASPPRLQ
jgi:hypothetical protein